MITTILAYLPEENSFILIEEGSGCSLEPNDYALGYVDYANLYIYKAGMESLLEMAEDLAEPIDGGMLLLRKEFRELTKTKKGLDYLIKQSIKVMFDEYQNYVPVPLGKEAFA